MTKKLKNAVGIVFLVVLIIVGFFGIRYGQQYFLEMTHKTTHKETVLKYANQYNVDEYLVFAVIKTESNFNHEAVSNVGARGLMQLMSNTFDWIQTKINDNNATYDDMFTPEINIQYGTFLLGYLVKEFDSYETALAAYHAGRGAVNNWLKDERYSDDGKTLKEVPISETNHYVEKVMKAFKIYKNLYEEKGEIL